MLKRWAFNTARRDDPSCPDDIRSALRWVANPIQARTLLHAVDQQRGGRRLVAFFGCLYYAALRPEEAISLAKHNLSLPTPGLG